VSEHENFKDDGYVIVKDFLVGQIIDYLYIYTLFAQKRLKILKANDIKPDWLDDQYYGTFDDSKHNGCFSYFGDLTTDTLLLGKSKEVKDITGIELHPSHSEFVIYKKDSIINPEEKKFDISIMVTLGYEKNWSTYIKPKNRDKIKLELNVGDALLFDKDVEITRDAFDGNDFSQLFLYYSNKNEVEREFNDRVGIGLPKDYTVNNVMVAQWDHWIGNIDRVDEGWEKKINKDWDVR